MEAEYDISNNLLETIEDIPTKSGIYNFLSHLFII